MNTSPNGRKLIESFEGLRLTSYQDTGGIWTIGYGHTGDVFEGETITEQDADTMLAIDLHNAEMAVYRNVQVTLNQNQFDALVSFVYNVGGGNFRSSTLLSLLNQSAYTGAANQFLAWDKIDGVPSKGLLNRREAERALFLTPEGS